MENRRWLVFANNDNCRHDKAFAEQGELESAES